MVGSLLLDQKRAWEKGYGLDVDSSPDAPQLLWQSPGCVLRDWFVLYFVFHRISRFFFCSDDRAKLTLFWWQHLESWPKVQSWQPESQSYLSMRHYVIWGKSVKLTNQVGSVARYKWQCFQVEPILRSGNDYHLPRYFIWLITPQTEMWET